MWRKVSRYVRPCKTALDLLEANVRASQELQDSVEDLNKTIVMKQSLRRNQDGRPPRSEPVTEP